MRCSSCESLLDRYLEATLPPRQMASVRLHLRTCDACASLLTELRIVDALLETTKSPDIAPNFTFAVMAEVNAMPAPHARRISPWSLLTFYLVAAWIALSGAYAAFGSHVPGIVSGVGAASGILRDAFVTMTSILHGLGPAAPITIAVVSFVLFLDALLVGGVIYFYRSVHPHLATVLARSEAR